MYVLHVQYEHMEELNILSTPKPVAPAERTETVAEKLTREARGEKRFNPNLPPIESIADKLAAPWAQPAPIRISPDVLATRKDAAGRGTDYALHEKSSKQPTSDWKQRAADVEKLAGPKPRTETIADQLTRAGNEADEIRRKLAPTTRKSDVPTYPLNIPVLSETHVPDSTESKVEQVKSIFQTSVDNLMVAAKDRNWPHVERIRNELTTMLELMPPEQRREAVDDAHAKVITALQAAVDTKDRILIQSVRETAKKLAELEVD